jgi:hypothetical protein
MGREIALMIDGLSRLSAWRNLLAAGLLMYVTTSTTTEVCE